MKMELTVFSKDELEAVHHASLRILSETGFFLSYRPAVELLCDNQARLQDGRVLLPPDLVERCLRLTPPTVALRGRDGKTAVLGDGSLHWHNLGGAREIFDPVTQSRRPAVIQDVRDSTRLLDGLSGATTIAPFFTPQDIPGEVMSLGMYRHAIPFTTKPLQGPGVQTPEEVRFAIEMAAVIGDPCEYLSLSVSPVSPLYIPDDIAAGIMEIAKAGIPFAPLPCPTAGTTAPLTLASAVAQQNAELLASIVLAQLVKPRLPVVYCGRLAVLEPRTGTSVWGGIELGLASAATVQIGHRYGLPVNVYGFATNAHDLDIQSGFERAINSAIPALAGADELSGIGEMEAGVMGSFAQMVCDSEFAGSVQRLRRGIIVDEDTLAVGLIAEVLRGDRNFAAERHTVRHLRGGEMFISRLAERGSWESRWGTDKRGMAARAHADALRILAEHQVPPLDEAQECELDRIMQAASGN
jgi:trimethylamine--corrinoid protein Co-methyltransferase